MQYWEEKESIKLLALMHRECNCTGVHTTRLMGNFAGQEHPGRSTQLAPSTSLQTLPENTNCVQLSGLYMINPPAAEWQMQRRLRVPEGRPAGQVCEQGAVAAEQAALHLDPLGRHHHRVDLAAHQPAEGGKGGDGKKTRRRGKVGVEQRLKGGGKGGGRRRQDGGKRGEGSASMRRGRAAALLAGTARFRLGCCQVALTCGAHYSQL